MSYLALLNRFMLRWEYGRALTVSSQLAPPESEDMLQDIPRHAGNLPIGAVVLDGAGMRRYSVETNKLLDRLNGLVPLSRMEMQGHYMVFFLKDGNVFPRL